MIAAYTMLTRDVTNGGKMQAKLREYEIYDATSLKDMMRRFCEETGIHDANIDTAIKMVNQGSPFFKVELCIIGSQPVGYIMLGFNYPVYKDGMVLEINDVFVKEEYRRKGIAKFMINSAATEYSKALSVTANIDSRNTAALKIMNDLGYSYTQVIKFEKNGD